MRQAAVMMISRVLLSCWTLLADELSLLVQT